MKRKLFSLFLAIVMLFSLGLNVFAEESHTTDITYIGDGTEWYKLTVPAELAPGETDTVILEGTWPSDRKVVVTADETVDLQNDINNTIKTLDIGFNGIEQFGDNYNEIYTTENISVADIEDALFGNWSGTFYYNAEVKDKIIGYELVPLENILDDDGNAYLTVGEQTNLSAVAVYSMDTPIWDSSNDSVVTVDSNGLVTAVSAGTATITYTMGYASGELIFVVRQPYASTFSSNSWSDIIWACQNNEVPSTWAVGNTKSMTIGGKSYNVRIIGKNHDSYSDGSGKAPLTFQLVECYGTKYKMNSTNTNSTGWSGSAMRTTHLNALLSAMPSEVQSAIKSVDKQTLKGDKSGLETTSDKLFLLSEVEVFGSTSNSNGYSEGSRYVYYANGGSVVKTYNGSDDWWWLRGPYYGNKTNFSHVNKNVTFSSNNASNSNGVAFGFCF